MESENHQAVQDIAAQDVATQDVAAQDVAGQDVAAQDIATQDGAAQDVAAQDIAAQDVATQDIATQDVAAQDVVGQDVAAQDVAAQDIAGQVKTKDATVQDEAAQDIAGQDKPKDVAAQDVAGQDVAAQDIAGQVKTKDATVQDIAVQDIAAQDVAAQDVAGQVKTKEQPSDLKKNLPDYLKFKKLQGSANLSGHKYEYKMASLLFMRGVNHTDGFYMATNLDGAGAFDDIVFRFKPRGHQEFRTSFLQFKHKTKTTKRVCIPNLVDVKGDFSLLKYYDSYCLIVNVFKNTDVPSGVLFDVPLHNCDFIIYSNAKLDKVLYRNREQLSEADRKLFRTNDKGFIFSLTPDKDDDIYSHANWKDKDEGMKEFLPRLKLFLEQASENQLDELIQREIQIALETNEVDAKQITENFIRSVQLWWEEQEVSEVLTENAQMWKNITDSRLDLMNDSKRKEMEVMKIRFTDQEIDSFHQSLSSSLVINVTSPHARLSGLKISQVLEKHHSKRFIFMSQESLLSWKREVLCAWQSKRCDVLVIECSTDVKSLVDELIKSSPDKKLILLSESALPGYQQLQDSFHWSLLDETSQDVLLEKQVSFQGYDVSLESVLGEHCTHALTGDIVTQLLTSGEKLKIGGLLDDRIPYYIPRSLEINDYVTKEIFRVENDIDVFVISNVKEQDVDSLESTYDVLLNEYEENQAEIPRQFYWTSSSFSAEDFMKLCEKIPNKNTHWLLRDENNKVQWKRSMNNIEIVKRNVDQNMKRTIRAEDITERIVILTAEPGMGKSSLITHLANLQKSMINSPWVIRINLNDVTRELNKISIDRFKNIESVANFLINAGVHNDCPFERNILRSRLMQTGNVSIYLDGYDEISPYYKYKVTTLIKSIKKMTVEIIWVTSRFIMQHHLESELDLICYKIKPFTDEDQINFFVKYWESKPNIIIAPEELKRFAVILQNASKSLSDKDRELTGIPLQCLMLSEAYESDLVKFVSTGFSPSAQRFDLLQLYDTFVSKKVDILYEEKEHIDTTKTTHIKKREEEENKMVKCHAYAAMILLLSPDEIKLLTSIDESTIVSEVSASFRDGREKTGLIDGMFHGKPRFVHKTFAEYFFSLFLSRNSYSSSVFLKTHLMSSSFAIVRQFFDRILARNCPLHRSVLCLDLKAVELLLATGSDVNQLDEGKRSALHLAASYPDIDPGIVQLLLDHQANANVADLVLKWTPLRYADKSESWVKVEHILRSGGKTDDLVETKRHVEIAKNEGIHTVKMQRMISTSVLQSIVTNGCSKLLEFIVDECELDANVDLFPTNEAEALISLSELPSDCKTTLLQAAARSGNEDCVRFLLERRANKLQRDYRDMMAIHHAAKTGHWNIIKLLVNAGVDIDALGPDGMTPLHVSVRAKQRDVTEWLIENGADQDKRDKNNKNILHYSDSQMFRDTYLKKMTRGPPDPQSEIHKAAQSGDLDTVKKLSAEGTDVNSLGKDNMTPLHYASYAGHIDVVQWLITNGAEVNAKGSDGMCSIHYAIYGGHFEVVKWLSTSGADLTAKGKFNADVLHCAAIVGNIDIVQWLVDSGADINARGNFNVTPFLEAALAGNLDTVKLLAEAGAEVNAVSVHNWGCLHYAAISGCLDVMKWLIDRGIGINIQGKDQMTALHCSAERGHQENVKWLLEAGADRNALNVNNEIPIHIAASSGHLGIVKILAKGGMDLNVLTKKQETPLHLAALAGRMDVVRWLVGSGANINARDVSSHTPLDLALRSVHENVAKFLKDAGADPPHASSAVELSLVASGCIENPP